MNFTNMSLHWKVFWELRCITAGYCLELPLRTPFIFWEGSVCFGFCARIEIGEKLFHVLQCDPACGEVTVETCVNF